MEHDEDPIGARLSSVLRGQAERDPLPPDFAAALAETLPHRARSRPRSVWVVGAFAATALAAVATFAVIALLIDQQIGTASPTPNASAQFQTGSPASESELKHFADDTIAFDYPSDWRVIEMGIEARHYQWILVVVGTGDWTLNCHAIPPTSVIAGGITCGADSFTVPPGGVVVEMSTWWGPATFELPTPPPTARELPGGLMATVVEGPTTSTWQLYIPGWMQPLTIEARFTEPGAELRRAEVEAMVESLIVLPRPSP
jgi:hypothetical protein